MARGRLLKTKVKEAKKIAEASEIGKARGIEKAILDRDFLDTIKLHIEKMWDKVEPLELAAVLAGTCIIKTAIEVGGPKVVDITALVLSAGTLSIPFIQDWFTMISGAPFPTDVEKLKTIQAQASLWIISFFLAFCIVKWGDKMLNAGISGVSGLIGLLGVV